MNHARFKSTYQGLSGIARKVYEVVPISEAWTAAQVRAELARQNVSISREVNVLEGCLNTLVSSGIVYEPERGKFRRVEITPPKEKKEPTMAVPTPHSPQVAGPVVVRKGPTALDRLATLSGEASKLGQRLVSLSKEIDDAILDAQQEAEAESAQYEKFRQMATLLKSL